MSWIMQNWWMLFLISFVVFLVTTMWMARVASHFYISSIKMRFSIFDFELPSSEAAFNQLLQLLDDKAKKHLRHNLLIDFLFMAGVYTGIALLCLKTSVKMEYFGRYLFLGLAALQIIPWLFDIAENIYLLRKISQPITSPEIKSKGFGLFQFLVKTKFIIAFTGTACSLFGLLYFWIVGDYHKETLPWLAVLFGLILLSMIVGKVISKPRLA